MSLLDQVKSWVDQEVPGPESIAQTLDNLCYRLAGVQAPEPRADIEAAIEYLVGIHPEPKPEVVRPETQFTAEPDTSPLIPIQVDEGDEGSRLSEEAKRKAFMALKSVLNLARFPL